MKKLSTLIVALLGMLGISMHAATVNFTLTVDVAERIVAQTMEKSSWAPIYMPKIVPLEDGANNVEATVLQPFNILTSSEDYVIKSVTVNGVEETISDPHMVMLFIGEDFGGSSVVVTTAEAGENPDPGEDPGVTTKYPVTFSFSDANARSYVENVVIDNRPLDDWENGIEVDANTVVTVQVNSTISNVTAYANNVEQTVNALFSNFTYAVTEATVFRFVTKEAVPDPTFTITVDDASRVEVGYTVQNMFYPVTTLFSLQNGSNTITITDGSMPDIFVRAKDGYRVDKVTVNGAEVADMANIPVVADMVLDITSSERPVEQATATFRCNDYSKVSLWINETEVVLTSNEQEVSFLSSSETVFKIDVVDPECPIESVTLNGNAVQGSGFGSNLTYMVYNVENGDVIEVTTAVAEEAVKYPVTFTFNGEGARSYITAVHAAGLDITDFEAGFEVEENTFVKMDVDTSVENAIVTVNGVETSYSSVYGGITFTVTGATEVSVSIQDTGIDMVISGSSDVYRLDGVKIMEGAEPAQVSTLPKGIYIIGNRKVVIR